MRVASLLLLLNWPLAGPAADFESLEERIERIRSDEGVPAYALVLVDRDGTRLSVTGGYADLATRRPVSPETRFRIGSITKSMTGMALLMAEAAGELVLDDPVADLVSEPPFTNPWAATRPITVAQLLEHSAGFQDWVQDEWDLNEPLPLGKALSYRPASRTAGWPPGRHSSYSNSGAGVAAWVFEQVTGQDFEDRVNERIFVPLGMSTARFTPDADVRATLATGYDRDGVSVIPYWHVILRPAAAVSLEPGDMAPYLRLLINRGRHDDDRLLTPVQVERLEHPQTTLAARAGLSYGYGLGIYQWQRDGHSLFGHGGDGDGFLAHFGYSVESGRGYFVVINVFRHRPLRRLRAVAEEWVIAPLGEATRPAAWSGGADGALAVYAGRYRQATQRFGALPPTREIEVTAAGGGLTVVESHGRKRRLIPVAPPLFRRPDDSTATVVFARDADGRMCLEGPLGNFERIDRD